MITREKTGSLYGHDVYDCTGDKIGTIAAVWSDDRGDPAWAGVRTGWFGTGESLVPLRDADLQGERVVVVPFEKAYVNNAPEVLAGAGEPLAAEEVARLHRYYAMRWDGSRRRRPGGSGERKERTGAPRSLS